MTTLSEASRQWASRPEDERFTSLYDMQDHFDLLRQQSAQKVVSSRVIDMVPDEDNKGIYIQGKEGNKFAPTHWAFDQLSRLAGAPPSFLRTLPSPIAADCINYGLKIARDVEDVGLLLHRNGSQTLRAATGPKYGRIWQSDILRGLTKNFGDGVTGDWRVPGEFGKDITVTKQNTTLYAGDRDMFVFLADEHNRIEVPNRRNGESGLMARGFFVWNSEVGAATFGIKTFLFDYVCSNRIVWGAADVKEIKMRHTVSAPDRFLEEIAPALHSYSNSSTKSITDGIDKARNARINNVDEFLANRFSKRLAQSFQESHILEEGKPIENIWEAVTAITAVARSIGNQDSRVEMETKAGELMKLAA